MLRGGLIGGVDLAVIQAAAVERPDLLVAHVGDHRLQLRPHPEEVLAHVGAVARLIGLIIAVERLVHPRQQMTLVILCQERVPPAAPDHLDHVPARTAEVGLKLLDDLAVAAHRAVEALQVAVDDKDQVVQAFTAGHADRAQGLGLVHLAVAHERPHLAPRGLGQAAPLQILHEAGLVDRHQRTEAHRDRGKLPEVRHQPRMRIAREPAAADLHPEAPQLLLGDPPLEIGAGVDAGARMALHVDQVAAVAVGRRVPEVVEAGLIQHRRRLVTRDMTAQLRAGLVGVKDRRDRVPTHNAAYPPLKRLIDRMRRLRLRRDRVQIRRRARGRGSRARQLRVTDDTLKQELRALRAVVFEDRIESIQPLARFQYVYVVERHLHSSWGRDKG